MYYQHKRAERQKLLIVYVLGNPLMVLVHCLPPTLLMYRTNLVHNAQYDHSLMEPVYLENTLMLHIQLHIFLHYDVKQRHNT